MLGMSVVFNAATARARPRPLAASHISALLVLLAIFRELLIENESRVIEVVVIYCFLVKTIMWYFMDDVSK